MGRIRTVHDANDESCIERWGDVTEEGEDEIKSVQRMVEREGECKVVTRSGCRRSDIGGGCLRLRNREDR